MKLGSVSASSIRDADDNQTSHGSNQSMNIFGLNRNDYNFVNESKGKGIFKRCQSANSNVYFQQAPMAIDVWFYRLLFRSWTQKTWRK